MMLSNPPADGVTVDQYLLGHLSRIEFHPIVSIFSVVGDVEDVVGVGYDRPGGEVYVPFDQLTEEEQERAWDCAELLKSRDIKPLLILGHAGVKPGKP